MASKPKTHRYYRESNTAINDSGVLTRPALLLTEGTITDASGRRTTYSRELIDAIVEASNAYLASNEIKLFNDHEYSQESRIGCVSGKFSAREITDIDLPENGDRSNIGKYAIFNDGLDIRSEDAIEQYHAGLLKELSIGIDLNGAMFGKNVIYEVSAVPFPAVADAHLYTKPMEEDTSKYAFTFESQIRRAMKDADEDDAKMMSSVERGYTAFSRAMDNIKNATDDELPKSRYKSIKATVSAFSDYLMGIYAPKPEEEPDTVPIVMMEKPMTEETTTYSAADFAAIQQELANLKKTNQDTLKFSALKDRANELVRHKKLTPAEYKNKFEGSEAFANYQAAIAKDPLEAFLDYVDTHSTPDPRLAPSVYGATPLINQDVPERPEADAKAIKERAAAVRTTKVSY